MWTPSKKAQTWVAYHFRPYRGRYPSEPILVYAVFCVNARSQADGDNLFKLVADAMQEAGVVGNDRQIRKHIVEMVTVPYGEERTVVWFGTEEEAEAR